MKKICSLFILFFSIYSGEVAAQVPVINSISGPTAVCSTPAAGVSFTANAINNPTAYTWTASNPSVIISNPTASATSISFPYSNGTYTLYCVASNSNGASPSFSYAVNVYETPSVTFSGNNIICQGSCTFLQASATTLMASPTVNFFWTPPTGLNTQFGPNVQACPASSTIYTVTATKGMCSNTAAISVSVVPGVTVSAVPGNTNICLGQSLTLNGFGATSYTWTQSVINGVAFTPTAAGIYFYMVTGSNPNGCSDTAGAQVNVYQTTFTVTPSANNVCPNTMVVLNTSGNVNTYSVNGSPVGNSPPVFPGTTTTYTITGEGQNGCLDTQTVTIVVIVCPGFKNNGFIEKDRLQVWPNPSNGNVHLRSAKGGDIIIVNELGQEIKKFYMPPESEARIADLPQGIYFIVGQETKVKLIVN